MKRLVPILLPTLLCACAAMPHRGEADWQTAEPLPVPPPVTTPGSIYQAGQGLNLFLDNRARQVGDVITINLVEKTNASKQSSTATDRKSSASMSAGTLLGSAIPGLSTQLDGAQTFDGKGSSSQSNSLTGSVSVTVYQVLPNGNLRVRGEKWVTLNTGEEFVRVSGTVRPIDIAPDNSVASWKVADARITYSGKGVLKDASDMGWLARLLQFISPL